MMNAYFGFIGTLVTAGVVVLAVIVGLALLARNNPQKAALAETLLAKNSSLTPPVAPPAAPAAAKPATPAK